MSLTYSQLPDETVNVYVVLQTPYLDEDALRSYLSRLVITLEAHARNSVHTKGPGVPLDHEPIFSGSVNESDDPVIVVQAPEEGADGSDQGHILVVWKLAATLSRPRLRLQIPSIVFSATANLKPAEQVLAEVRDEEYLPSQVPAGLNLLESFGSDMSLPVTPKLSALRVSRVVPATKTAKDLMRPFRNISRREVRALPPFSARIKYSRPTSSASDPQLLASLDVTSYSACDIVLKKVDLSIIGGSVENLGKSQGLTPPVTCHPNDDVIFIYRLSHDDHLEATSKTHSQVRVLDITIDAVAKISETCHAPISMQWSTGVDFSLPVNAGFGIPSQALQRNHRPSSLSIGSASGTSLSRPDLLPAFDVPTSRQRADSTVPDFGVTMTFTGPDNVVSGETFCWDVFVVNRSDRPRKLAVVVLPKRNRRERKMPAGSAERRDVAEAVLDGKFVYAMQRAAATEASDIVCLSTDIRIGCVH